jgi:hypothetical protein
MNIMMQGEARTLPFVLLSKGKEVPCVVMFPIGAMIGGDREILLEMMKEVCHTVSKTGYNRFAITVNFDED